MYIGNLPQISNRADWIGTVEIVNDETGEVITDLTGIEINLVLRERLCKSPRLTATTANGKAEDIGGGVIKWRFTAPEMFPICAGSYELGITLSRDGVTEQQLVATQPIIDGVVR